MRQSNKRVVVILSLSDTVGTLKAKIQEQENIASERQRLIFQGRQLKDMNILSACGVNEGSLILLVSAPDIAPCLAGLWGAAGCYGLVCLFPIANRLTQFPCSGISMDK